MCQERRRTRDRLLEYDPSIIIPTPHTAGLAMIYPWENTSLSVLSNEIYQIVQRYGYQGTEAEFWFRFTGGTLVVGTLATFPIEGNVQNLYLDKETDTLYHYKIYQGIINTKVAEDLGATIVNIENDITYLYIPIKSMLIEDVVINGGEI